MKINEIFYSLQGEGLFSGTPCVFVRFAGCNLNCEFCDTSHKYFTEYTSEELVREVEKYPTKHVVLTGGEPTLQITQEFMLALKECGKIIHVETNGTRKNRALYCAHFVTCSPKFEFCHNANIVLDYIHELKVVFNGSNNMGLYKGIEAAYYYLQPCDTGNAEKNKAILDAAIAYCLEHPKWSLSLQTQKILNVR
jgi:7-carboxy-7-deazaguanine synthase